MLCLGVGALTGLIVSIYRWGLGYANHIRESIFSHEDMSSPMFLMMVWIDEIYCCWLFRSDCKNIPKPSGSGMSTSKRDNMLRWVDYKWFQELMLQNVGTNVWIECGLSLGRECWPLLPGSIMLIWG